MSYADRIFKDNCREILTHGVWDTDQNVRPHWEDGTPAHTVKKFGIVNRYNLRQEFPILTIRRTYFKTCIDELLWIWQLKSSNVHDLRTRVWDAWADENVEPNFSAQRTEAMRLLQTEAELNEIVQLVGVDALSHGDRLILETARSIREDFLHQNSFHEVDTYTSLHKQYRMMKLILTFYKEANEAIKQGVTIQKLTKMDVIERIGRAKYVEEINVDKSYDEIEREIKTEVAELIRKGADEL